VTAEENEFQETKWRRIRRVKRWLRPLPRRATIHRYPILKFFAEAARKRSYIWSFRVENAVPAIYAGSILTLMPLYGIQLPLALLLALLLRANLPILAGLQIVSNPLTAVPIWVADFQVGRVILGIIGIETMPLTRNEILNLLYDFVHLNWGDNFERMSSVFGITSLGAIVMGVFFGLVGSISYRIVASRTAASYEILKKKVHLPKLRKSQTSANENDNTGDST
jgi:uncharacterized protein (DUF2062 family)